VVVEALEATDNKAVLAVYTPSGGKVIGEVTVKLEKFTG
jgi:hypothetical protein